MNQINLNPKYLKYFYTSNPIEKLAIEIRETPSIFFSKMLTDLTNLVKVSADEFLLLDELDIGEGLGRQLDGLVEAVLAAVGHVHQFYDLKRR